MSQDGPPREIVLGPPGTGKTTKLLSMVEEELERGVAPEQIGFLTFTRKAAQEASERAAKKFGFEAKRLVHFRTLHSLCFRALGIASADVLQGEQLVSFGDWAGVKVTGRWSMEEGSSFGFEMGDRCLHMENMARITGYPLRKMYDLFGDDGLPWNTVEYVARALAEWKRTKNVVDYTDMLTLFAESQYRTGIESLFVDEAQDLSMLQWRVVDTIAKNARRLVIAGDDDQAIYRWAGAAVNYFVAMPGQIQVLGQSWRVPSAVQPLAMGTLNDIKNRREKPWRHRDGDVGQLERVQSLDEIEFGKGEDVLVLARNACFLRDDVMPILQSEGIVYEFRNSPSVRHSVVDSVLLWEKLRNGGAITVSDARRVYELMSSGATITRGYKKLPGFADPDMPVTLGQLQIEGGLKVNTIWHEALDGITPQERAYMLKALRRGERLTRRPTVRLSTIHGAKGGEADHVVIIRDMAWRTFKESQYFPEDEARVWYVALTRPRQRLTIVAPKAKRSREI